MKQILLNQGMYCQVSDEDFDYLNQFSWNARVGRKTLYAIRIYYDKIKKKNISVLMHREVMNTSDCSVIIDHKDMNGLNNQRENLRVATHSENMSNRSKFSRGTSKYKGVCRTKTGGWQVSLKAKGKMYRAHAINETDAAIKYNELAKTYHGEFAQLNNISETEMELYYSRLKEPNQDTDIEKTCRKCKKTKPRTEFSKDKNRTDGYNTYCKKCEKDRKKVSVK